MFGKILVMGLSAIIGLGSVAATSQPAQARIPMERPAKAEPTETATTVRHRRYRGDRRHFRRHHYRHGPRRHFRHYRRPDLGYYRPHYRRHWRHARPYRPYYGYRRPYVGFHAPGFGLYFNP